MPTTAKKPGRKPTGAKKAGRPKAKVEEPSYLCPYCNTVKKRSEYYVSTDPLVRTGVTNMCKDCAKKIARNYDPKTGQYGDCTKESIIEALERLDKPFFENLFNSSYVEGNDPSNRALHGDTWEAYIKNICSLKQYKTLRWHDGDIASTYMAKAEAAVTPIEQQLQSGKSLDDQEVYETYQKNKESVIRLLGYDPFASEAENDKPLLYSQLVGYLDMGGDNEDMMRNSSAITIVRGFLQQSKIDDMLAKSMKTIGSKNRAGEIKSLLDSKQKISSTISQLAEQSCLSLKHNKNQSKGENTWTGKVKKIKELNLREGEVNGFDIATCKGMQQVMDLSNASILKQLALDESEYSDMIAEQRKLVTKLTTEKNSYQEITRILLRENLDLRDTLSDNDLLDKENLTNLEDLFSSFGDVVEADEEEGENDESNEA